MFRIGCVIVIVTVFLTMAGPVRAQSTQQWDAQAVEKSIEKAKAYIWSEWSEGHWPELGKPGQRDGGPQQRNYGGVTASCAYALLAAGESPQTPRMKKTLEWLAEVEMLGTYARALRANVWGMLGRDSKYRRFLKKDVDWLVEAAGSHGAYSYTYARGDHKGANPEASKRLYDNSNSQFAVMSVWAGSRNGVEVPREYWKRVEKHWLTEQNSGDGGWAYRKGHKSHVASYGSMTAAGLATMFICFDELYREEFIRCSAETDYAPIVRGLDWMDKNFIAFRNPGKGGSYYYYYLYGVERVGLASGYKYFGKKDWYKLCASNLIKRQASNGSWGGRLCETSFALLFLARGQHPVLFNKLQYPGSWNCRPRDLANLTRRIVQTFEKEVNWQIIPLSVPVEEWHDAPILYISGAKAPKFTDKDIESLRKFVHQGGVIFSEAACSKGAFNSAMQKYYAKIFPNYELTRLPMEHPIYSIHYKVRKRRLMGISNGVRLLAIHSPVEVSLAWQMNATDRSGVDVFNLGANIYFYVTDKGSLRNRGVSPWPIAQKFTPTETLKVALIKHTGNCNPEPMAWERFSILMGNRHKIAVKVTGPTAIAELDAANQPAAAMTGTAAFSFDAEDCRALRKYIDAGGTLIIDAAGGSNAFSASVEKVIAKILPEGRYGPIVPGHSLYTRDGFVIKKISYRKAFSGSVASSRKPRLRGVLYKGRLAIIFSRDDLTAGLLGYPCWGLRGYEPESAFALMRNILLYASGKTLKE